MRLLFIDYSSAFNTIVPSRLIAKLNDLGLNYLKEVEGLTHWCQHNNLLLNVSKTKELIVDFWQVWSGKWELQISPQVLRNFYFCTREGVLMGNIAAWYGNSTKQDHKALQRVVCLAERIIGGTLPCLKDIYTRWCKTNDRKIIKDTNHPDNSLFSLLRSRRRQDKAGQIYLYSTFHTQKQLKVPYRVYRQNHKKQMIKKQQ